MTSLREEFKLLKVFYSGNLLTSFATSMVAGFWAVYFLGIGFSPIQVSLLIVCSTVAMLIFEVPTGAFADHFGRKKSVALSCFIAAIGFIALPFFNSFLPVAVIYFTFGISQTFQTGAEDAWFIDSIKYERREDITQRGLARLRSMASIGIIPGAIIASIVVIYGTMSTGLPSLQIIRWLWAACGLVFLVAGLIFVIFGKEPYFKPKKASVTELFNNIFTTSGKGIKFVVKHKVIFSLVIASMLFFFSSAIISIGWQQYLQQEVHINEAYFGFIFAGMSAITAIILNFTDKFAKRMKHERYALLLLGLVLAAAMFMLALSPMIAIAVVGFAIYFILFDMHTPIHTCWLNRFVPSKVRATIGSVESMFISVASLLGGFIGYGLVTHYFGLRAAFLFCGIVTAASALIYLAIKEK